MKKTPLLLILLLLASFPPACGKMGKRKSIPGPSDKVFSVNVARVVERNVPDTLEIKGVFAPAQKVEIKSEFSGKVQALSVVEGQTVASGDVLLKIEDEKLQWVLDRQRAELREAEAQLELDTRVGGVAGGEEGEEVTEVVEEAPVEPNAGITPPEENVENPEAVPGEEVVALATPGVEEEGPLAERRRLRELRRAARLNARRQTVVTPTRPAVAPEQNESRVSLDQAKIDRIKAEIAFTEKQMAGSTVISPMDGFVSKVAVAEGSTVKPEDLLVTIVQVDPIDLVLKVPKDQIEKIEKNMEVKATSPDLPNLSFQGEISFIGAELDADRKALELRVRVGNSAFRIKIGMEGVAELGVANKTHPALLIPPIAVLRDKDGKYLYVVRGQVAERQEVETGSSIEGLVEIKKGLKKDDQVVTQGLDQLKQEEEFVRM